MAKTECCNNYDMNYSISNIATLTMLKVRRREGTCVTKDNLSTKTAASDYKRENKRLVTEKMLIFLKHQLYDSLPQSSLFHNFPRSTIQYRDESVYCGGEGVHFSPFKAYKSTSHKFCSTHS